MTWTRPPAVHSGIVPVHVVLLLHTTSESGAEPKSAVADCTLKAVTPGVLLKPVPVMVTVVPPIHEPTEGETLLTLQTTKLASTPSVP